MVLLNLLFSLLVVNFMAKTDASTNFVDHSSRWLTRFSIFLLLLVNSILSSTIYALVFLVFFDTFYNLWRGNKWNYIGETAKIDKKLSYRPWVWYAYKLVSLIFLIVLIYYNI